MSKGHKNKFGFRRYRFKLVRTSFTVYEIKVDNKAFVGVTGRDVQKAVEDRLYLYRTRHRVIKNNRLISAKMLREIGFRKFYDQYVTILGTFDRPAEAQVAAIRRQNELSHTHEMVSSNPGQCIGTRQLLPDETLKSLEDELNEMQKTMPKHQASFTFYEKHNPLHGYKITAHEVKTSASSN